MTLIKGSFQLSAWNEDAYEERDGRRLTRASVSQRFEGDIAGDGAAEWLMAYQADGRRPVRRVPACRRRGRPAVAARWCSRPRASSMDG